MNTIIFLLISYGFCNNVIYGSIFEGFRNFLSKFGDGPYSVYKLFTCFMCLSTWFGFLLSWVFIYLGYGDLTPLGSIGLENVYLNIFLNGLLTSGGVWLIHNFEESLERIGS